MHRLLRRAASIALLGVLVGLLAPVATAPGATAAPTGTATGTATGGRDTTRLLDGFATTDATYPWQAELTIRDRYLCGGVLISPRVVLTAAHCALPARTPAGIRVSLGRTHTFHGGAKVTVSSIIVNPHFKKHRLAGDWAVLVLASPAPSRFTPIQIAGAQDRALWRAGRHGVATGYGVVRENGPISSTLRKVRLPILNDASCSRSAAYGHQFDSRTMLCAGDPKAGRDTCQGDSGGPLVARAHDGTSRLVGLVSFGRGCALKNHPGVYTRIAGPAVRDALMTVLDADPVTAGYPYVSGSD